jgi:hypothetical protein
LVRLGKQNFFFVDVFRYPKCALFIFLSYGNLKLELSLKNNFENIFLHCDRKTERQRDRKTERQKERKKERKKDRERQKEGETERQKDRKYFFTFLLVTLSTS